MDTYDDTYDENDPAILRRLTTDLFEPPDGAEQALGQHRPPPSPPAPPPAVEFSAETLALIEAEAAALAAVEAEALALIAAQAPPLLSPAPAPSAQPAAPAPPAAPQPVLPWDEVDRLRHDPAARAAFVGEPPPVKTRAQFLADRYVAQQPPTVFRDGRFLRCQAGVWHPLPLEQFHLEVNVLVETDHRHGNLRLREVPACQRQVADYLRLQLAAGLAHHPPDPHSLPCLNGLLHLPTGVLRPIQPSDSVTHTLPYAFDPAARAPVWDAFLESTLPAAAEFLQEFAGLCLTFDTRHELALWLYGPPGAGKSVFLHGLQVLLGPRCGELNLPQLLAGRFDPASVAGKSLMVCPEPVNTTLTHTARLNAFISGEPFTIEPKYRPAQVIQPAAKLAWAFTTLPRVPDAGSPLFRRLSLIPLPARPKDQQDPSLKARLESEGPGLLNWAVAGLHRLLARGRFQPPPEVITATEHYQQANDLPAQFLDDNCDRDPKERLAAGKLYLAYKQWCLANGHQPAASNVLSRDWLRLGFERRLAEGRYYWHGLKFRTYPRPAPPKPASEFAALTKLMQKS